MVVHPEAGILQTAHPPATPGHKAHLGDAAGLKHLLQLPLLGCHSCRQLLGTPTAGIAHGSGRRNGGAGTPPLGPQGGRRGHTLACEQHGGINQRRLRRRNRCSLPRALAPTPPPAWAHRRAPSELPGTNACASGGAKSPKEHQGKPSCSGPLVSLLEPFWAHRVVRSGMNWRTRRRAPVPGCTQRS